MRLPEGGNTGIQRCFLDLVTNVCFLVENIAAHASCFTFNTRSMLMLETGVGWGRYGPQWRQLMTLTCDFDL